MAPANHHVEYDDGTLLKLELLEQYLTSWLPVFLHLNCIKTINIFDFFSGPGGDSVGQKGSPLRVVDAVKKYSDKANGKQINAIFSDKRKKCAVELKNRLENNVPQYLKVFIECGDYENVFAKYRQLMGARGTANFIFMDPFGLLTPTMVEDISSLPMTDFLLFLPARFIARFKDTEEFKNKWPGIEKIHLKKLRDVPKSFCDVELKKHVPADYHLAHFVIRKQDGGSTHGLIFGSGNVRGLEKFLEACWKADPENGEANFSLDGDLPTVSDQQALPGIVAGSKLRNFNTYFRKQVLGNKVQTNKDAYYGSLEKACLPRHARDVFSELKAEGLIANTVHVSYDTVVKKKKIQPIMLTK